jgi:hypothetical protein
MKPAESERAVPAQTLRVGTAQLGRLLGRQRRPRSRTGPVASICLVCLEDGNSKILQNVGKLLPIYTTS